jgi:hypothetical protein
MSLENDESVVLTTNTKNSVI